LIVVLPAPNNEPHASQRSIAGYDTPSELACFPFVLAKSELKESPTMPSPSVAAAGGFFLGSIVTYFFMTTFDWTKKTKHQTEAELTPTRKGRSLSVPASPSTSYAAVSSSVERVGFLSDIVTQLWSYIIVVGADAIQSSIEPMFKEMLPSPLSTLHFTKINLGTTPMRLDNVVVHDLRDGAVQFDLDLVWVTDCEINLKADYVGSFGVESIELMGRMTFLLNPLTATGSIISAVQFAFINPPTLELNFSGLAAIADFKFLDKKIQSILQDSLSVVVLPSRMTVKLDAACSFYDVYEPPVGIARVTLVSGYGFQAELNSISANDIPDVYCNISLGNKTWKTSTVKNSLTPQWKNEVVDFILSDRDQIISIHAWDEDTGLLDQDDDLGNAQVTVGEIILAGKTKDLELQQRDKGTGALVKLHCSVCKLTTELGSLTANVGPNMICGVLVILVCQAFNVPIDKDKASSFIKVTCGSSEFVTATVTDCPGVDALNPTYDCAFHMPLTVDVVKNSDVGFHLMNGTPPSTLGSLMVTQSDLVAAKDRTVTGRRKLGNQGASLEFRILLRGVEEAAPIATVSTSNESASPAPTSEMDTVRVTLVKGHGFVVENKSVFKKTDIPDPYCKIRFGSSPIVWRTSTSPNTTEPVWNESTEYALSDKSQIISIDVLDEDKGVRDEDDLLGSARVAIGKLLLAGGTMDVELLLKGVASSAYISLRAELVSHPP
jgi:hypothetical protein